MSTTWITSESVTEGHPDKLCDQVSDALLDKYLAQDPQSRVAIETLATTGLLVIAGEVRSKAIVDVQAVARAVLAEIGYTDAKLGIGADTAAVISTIHGQSPDIALGVDERADKELGAGDQGLMYGFACSETPQLLPLPIVLSHALTKRLATVRKQGILSYLGPDGKAQVSIEYRDGQPARASAIVVSAQHDADIPLAKLRADIRTHVIEPVCKQWLDSATTIYINPTGNFVIGGPHGDTGLTGRKIIVDTYGGVGRHGGGAFSGKDPSKVDRSGAYAARWIAKNVVAAGLARTCEVQLSYAIGIAEPTSVHIDTFHTNTIPEEEIVARVRAQFDLRPKAIIAQLNLLRPIYRQLAAYGHFGRSEAPWEDTSRASLLRAHVVELTQRR